MNVNGNPTAASQVCGRALEGQHNRAGRGRGAFTLLELLVMLGLVAVLSCMLLPGLAHTQQDARTAQCLGNKRQMALACAMYSHDWSDYLVPSAPVSAGNGSVLGWCGAEVNWGTAMGNVFSTFYTTNCLGRYLAGQVKPYKCPFDTIPSDNGPRIRSISMNPALVGDINDMGSLGQAAYRDMKAMIGNYRLFVKMADLNRPGAANTWLFCDESMYSLNDGYLE